MQNAETKQNKIQEKIVTLYRNANTETVGDQNIWHVLSHGITRTHTRKRTCACA